MAFRDRTQRSGPAGTIAPRKHSPNEVIALQLGDFLDRLPKEFLAPGNHDPSAPLNFEIPKVAKQIIEGRPTIELVEIYRQVPRIFAGEIKISDNVQVRFPWPKLVEMLRAAHKNTSDPGLTRAAALHLARLLRGFRGIGTAARSASRSAAGSAASARAPQWFTRNAEQADSSAEGERILEELASALEQFAPGESPKSPPPNDHIETSDEFAITVEENTRLRRELDERDREIQSLRKTLEDLENAAVDEVAALNAKREEYETALAKSHSAKHEQIPLNPQQTAMIDALSHQVTELYHELDRARDETLEATAAQAKYRDQADAAATAAVSMQEYLASVAYELERANAVLKELEAKAHHAESALAAKDVEIAQLAHEHATLMQHFSDVRAERDALRGALYGMSPGEPIQESRS